MRVHGVTGVHRDGGYATHMLALASALAHVPEALELCADREEKRVTCGNEINRWRGKKQEQLDSNDPHQRRCGRSKTWFGPSCVKPASSSERRRERISLSVSESGSEAEDGLARMIEPLLEILGVMLRELRRIDQTGSRRRAGRTDLQASDEHSGRWPPDGSRFSGND